MYLSESTNRYQIIGTVFGGGYDCRRDKIQTFEGSTDGMWSGVSVQLDWIKSVMSEISTQCRDSVDDLSFSRNKFNLD